MAHINRKYIDSHWLIFILKGISAVLIGGYTLFDTRRSLSTVITTVGIFLLSFAIIEFVNALFRARQKTGWAVSVTLAIVDAVVALALLFTADQATSGSQGASWHLYIISAYTFIRGFAEIVSGFRATVDPTDRFTWVFSGMVGAIMGIVILNSDKLFINYFGVYLIVLGICSLFYGVHNREQKLEDQIARRESASLSAKNRRKKSSRKVAKRSRK